MHETEDGRDVLAEDEPFLGFALSCDLRRRERDARLLGVGSWLSVLVGLALVVTSAPDRARMMAIFLLAAPLSLICHIGARGVRYQIRLFRIIRALHQGRAAAGTTEAGHDMLAEDEFFLGFVLSCDLRRRERDARLLGVGAWLAVLLGLALVVTSTPDRARTMAIFVLVAPLSLIFYVGARGVRHQIRLFRIIRALHQGRAATDSTEAGAHR